MPLKLEDAADHIASIPNRQSSMFALLDAIKSGVASIDSAAGIKAFLADLEATKERLVAAVESGLPGSHRNLGPGETPLMPGDQAIDARTAEDMGNPIIPRDMGGNKMHPADALSQTGGTKAAPLNDLRQAGSFGGNGQGGLEDTGLKTSSHVEPITGDTIRTTVDASGQVVDVERIPRVGVENGQIDSGNGPIK